MHLGHRFFWGGNASCTWIKALSITLIWITKKVELFAWMTAFQSVFHWNKTPVYMLLCDLTREMIFVRMRVFLSLFGCLKMRCFWERVSLTVMFLCVFFLFGALCVNSRQSPVCDWAVNSHGKARENTHIDTLIHTLFWTFSFQNPEIWLRSKALILLFSPILVWVSSPLPSQAHTQEKSQFHGFLWGVFLWERVYGCLCGSFSDRLLSLCVFQNCCSCLVCLCWLRYCLFIDYVCVHVCIAAGDFLTSSQGFSNICPFLFLAVQHFTT